MPPAEAPYRQLARAPPIRREQHAFGRHDEPEDELGPVEPARLPAECEHPEEQCARDHERDVEAAVRHDGKRTLGAAGR